MSLGKKLAAFIAEVLPPTGKALQLQGWPEPKIASTESACVEYQPVGQSHPKPLTAESVSNPVFTTRDLGSPLSEVIGPICTAMAFMGVVNAEA
jgi:hypothetical protein